MKLYKFFHFCANKNECAIVWFRFSTSEKLPFPLFFIIKLLILNLLFTKLLATLTAC